MDFYRPMQNDINRFARLFDSQYIAPRFEDAAMSALGNPLQLRERQTCEQLDVCEQIASIVFSPWYVSHGSHILHPSPLV
jgi:hypothetical protein